MWKPDEDEFFIGYEPPMPPQLARFVSRAVAAVGSVLLVWGITLAAGHLRLEGGTFEFGHPTSFSGTVVERPYPALKINGAEADVTASLLLVAPGKRGAESLVRGVDGRHVTLTGTRIQRGTHTMVEVVPESIAPRTTSAGSTNGDALLEQPTDERVELTGEVVDSKCFLGVMVPGSGKTHKECASLCLRGGIPPALFVHDGKGRSSLLLMTGASGEPIAAKALLIAGEAVAVTGSIRRDGSWLVLQTDPSYWHRIQ